MRGSSEAPFLSGFSPRGYIGYMKTARIGELKNNLSHYVEYVRDGGTVLVLDRDNPVAQIVPLPQATPCSTEDEEHLARLESRGFIRRGTGGFPAQLDRRKPPRVRGSVLQDLLAERESGW
jgi:antitoxin (DNA-binding transcriptional repressor) of toxin-antitoxin stability system